MPLHNISGLLLILSFMYYVVNCIYSNNLAYICFPHMWWGRLLPISGKERRKAKRKLPQKQETCKKKYIYIYTIIKTTECSTWTLTAPPHEYIVIHQLHSRRPYMTTPKLFFFSSLLSPDTFVLMVFHLFYFFLFSEGEACGERRWTLLPSFSYFSFLPSYGGGRKT